MTGKLLSLHVRTAIDPRIHSCSKCAILMLMGDRTAAGRSLSTLRISIADMVALGVRTGGTQKRDLPAVLYQSLPSRALALMSTIPQGAFAVSIPGRSRLNQAYPVLKAPSPPTDGFVIAYSRRQNGRYEADRVQYHGREFGIEEFVGIARQWVERNAGNPKPIPGRYVYFAPTREEWGVVLRDSGYTAWNPTGMSADFQSEWQASRQALNRSAIVIRMPVYAGEKQSGDEILPVFAQVEVMLNSVSAPHCAWVGFAEYRQNQARRSRLPESISPDFREWLDQLTEESGFDYWIFDSGMLFGDCVEWWGDGCRRRTEHEGVDFAKGFRSGAGICNIPEGVPVRSIAEGEVTTLLDDFMGKTVVVCHRSIARSNGDVFHTLLSHIQPAIAGPGPVAKGQILGRVGRSTNVHVPAHLHLTGAWLPKTLNPGKITMDLIHPAYAPIALTSFEILMHHNPLCRCSALWKNRHGAR